MNHEFGMLNQFEQEASLRFERTSYQATPHLPQAGLLAMGQGLEGPQGLDHPGLGGHGPSGLGPQLQEFTPISLDERQEELPQTNNQLHSLLTL